MPRFYFDVHGLHGFAADATGEEFADAGAAGREALELLPELLRGEKLTAQGCLLDVTLRDETGRAILIATLSLSSHAPGAAIPAGPQPAAAQSEVPRAHEAAAPSRTLSVQHRGLADACRETAVLLNRTRLLLERINAG